LKHWVANLRKTSSVKFESKILPTAMSHKRKGWADAAAKCLRLKFEDGADFAEELCQSC
jgi:hypothetical protein